VPVPQGASTTPATTTPVPAPVATNPAVVLVITGSRGTAGAATVVSPSPWVVLVVVVGTLALLLLLIAGLARWRAWDPPWLRRARHSCAEASWRVGGTWSEFTDWVRLGR